MPCFWRTLASSERSRAPSCAARMFVPIVTVTGAFGAIAQRQTRHLQVGGFFRRSKRSRTMPSHWLRKLYPNGSIVFPLTRTRTALASASPDGNSRSAPSVRCIFGRDTGLPSWWWNVWLQPIWGRGQRSSRYCPDGRIHPTGNSAPTEKRRLSKYSPRANGGLRPPRRQYPGIEGSLARSNHADLHQQSVERQLAE